MRRFLLFAALLVALIVPAAASATQNVVGPQGWGVLNNEDDPWIDPESDTGKAVGGNVKGGDGDPCSLADVLEGCDVDYCELWGRECNGDEGTGEVCYIQGWIVLCRHTSSAYDGGDGNPNHDFVESDQPPPDNPTTYINCWEEMDPELYAQNCY